MEARHGVERVNSHVHLTVSSACTLYDTPEDGCVLYPKHVEQKCNKITLNNLHQASHNKPIHYRVHHRPPLDPILSQLTQIYTSLDLFV